MALHRWVYKHRSAHVTRDTCERLAGVRPDGLEDRPEPSSTAIVPRRATSSSMRCTEYLPLVPEAPAQQRNCVTVAHLAHGPF
jgi:hypothetical protein